MSIISSSLTGRSTAWPSLYAAVALTTAATLILELSLTRIFSVVFYYHFAFLAISVALFGLGAGGVLSYYLAAHGPALFRRLGTLALLNALTVVVALALVLQPGGRGADFVRLGTVYLAAALPFILAGAVVSLAIAETVERVERVYLFDLLGAAAGCLLVIPFLNMVGGPGAVLASAVLYAAAGAVWFGLARASTGRALGVSLALLLVALILVNKRASILDVHSAKGSLLAAEKFVEWNSFSRVSLLQERPGASPLIAIDADATTGIPGFDLDHLTSAERNELLSHGPGFPYRLRPGGKTLVIGAGGGWDVARAIASGSKEVVGVEINPIIADTIMRRRFPDLSRRLFSRPEVRIVVEDARSFVRRDDGKYRLIQATLVDTWASTAAGAFALSENNIYTLEAFRDYLHRLSDDGVLAFTRWGFEPPRESLRLISLAREALLAEGETDPARHIIVVRENARQLSGWGATDSVLISRKPLPVEDLEQAAKAASLSDLEILYMPGQSPDSPFAQLLLARDVKAFLAGYRYDVSAVSDDRPFFFYTVQPRDIWNFRSTASHESADFKINLALPTLFSLLAVSLIATAIMIALPRLLPGTRLPAEKGVAGFLIYFLLLGAGYILVQVGLIQKLVLLLGHPTYALTVVIFSMLVSSGLGSHWSRRVVSQGDRRLCAVLATVAVLVALVALLATPIISWAATFSLPAKVLVALLLIAPAGFFMGMPFPAGMKRLNQHHPESLRWAWSLNSAASVLGSSSAIFLAIYGGLRVTMLAGAVAYGLAVAAVWMTARREGRAV